MKLEIELSEAEHQALVDCAYTERREPAMQAAYLVSRGLEQLQQELMGRVFNQPPAVSFEQGIKRAERRLIPREKQAEQPLPREQVDTLIDRLTNNLPEPDLLDTGLLAKLPEGGTVRAPEEPEA